MRFTNPASWHKIVWHFECFIIRREFFLTVIDIHKIFIDQQYFWLEKSFLHLELDFLSKRKKQKNIWANMLLNKLIRPAASIIYKVPTRSTSAVCGAKSRHVSTVVSIFIFLSNKVFWYLPFGNIWIFTLEFIINWRFSNLRINWI